MITKRKLLNLCTSSVISLMFVFNSCDRALASVSKKELTGLTGLTNKNYNHAFANTHEYLIELELIDKSTGKIAYHAVILAEPGVEKKITDIEIVPVEVASGFPITGNNIQNNNSNIAEKNANDENNQALNINPLGINANLQITPVDNDHLGLDINLVLAIQITGNQQKFYTDEHNFINTVDIRYKTFQDKILLETGKFITKEFENVQIKLKATED